MSHWIYCFLFPLCIFANFFESRIEKASTGDFIILEQNKILSLISIQKKTNQYLWIEQITFPRSQKQKISNWNRWVQSKAPGHTSWIRYEVDLQTKKITECFSYSQSAWLKLKENQSILTTLLEIDLQKIPDEMRKKVGPPPAYGEEDHRRLWKPFMVYQGEILPVSADAYIATWPKDGTELAGKSLELFFDLEEKIAFPYWILIHTKKQTFTIHILDCGKSLQSPFSDLPRRAPQFSEKSFYNEEGLFLEVESPIYYKDFYLYAKDLQDPFHKPHMMDFDLKKEGEHLVLHLGEKQLEKLQQNHYYHWHLIPKEFPKVHAESKTPFRCKKTKK